jgi:hypothetical protein
VAAAVRVGHLKVIPATPSPHDAIHGWQSLAKITGDYMLHE